MNCFALSPRQPRQHRLGNRKTRRDKSKHYFIEMLRLFEWLIGPWVIVPSFDCVLNIQVRFRVPGNYRPRLQQDPRFSYPEPDCRQLLQLQLLTPACSSFSAAPSQKVQFYTRREFHRINIDTYHRSLAITWHCDTDPGPWAQLGEAQCVQSLDC